MLFHDPPCSQAISGAAQILAGARQVKAVQRALEHGAVDIGVKHGRHPALVGAKDTAELPLRNQRLVVDRRLDRPAHVDIVEAGQFGVHENAKIAQTRIFLQSVGLRFQERGQRGHGDGALGGLDLALFQSQGDGFGVGVHFDVEIPDVRTAEQ